MRGNSSMTVGGRWNHVFVLAAFIVVGLILSSGRVSAQAEGASGSRLPASFGSSSSVSLSSIVWSNCPLEVAEEAERILIETRNLADRDVLSRFDVIDAEMFAFDAKRCANQLSKRDYCNQKRTLLAEFTRLLGELMASGSGRYLPSRREWVRWSAELSTICGG